MWVLRRRVPRRYLSVANQAGGIVKISTGHKDDKLAMRAWPDVLRRWEEMVAEWEKRLNVVSLTPERAAEIAARWAAWVAADLGRLEGEADDAAALDDSSPEGKLLRALAPDGAGRDARAVALLEAAAADALKLVDFTAASDTLPLLKNAVRPAIVAAHRQAGLRESGIVRAVGARWHPLQAARAALPTVPDAPLPARPGTSLTSLFKAWAAVTPAKPRTVTETRYVLDLLGKFVEHGDGSSITRGDVRSWRDAAKLAGLTNNTWNNRLSLVRQVFAQAVADGHLTENPADNSLRLRKSKAAARRETSPALRWAHWIMAFSGMRVGELLQLTRGDIRQDGDIWAMAVHEDNPGKSVKTGQRRHVPVHPALIAEGLIAYVHSLPPDGPLFPDKRVDRHGNRGGQG